ncbi:3175_t:CDS:1, partial [Dentiscutata erythropus]
VSRILTKLKSINNYLYNTKWMYDVNHHLGILCSGIVDHS